MQLAKSRRTRVISFLLLLSSYFPIFLLIFCLRQISLPLVTGTLLQRSRSYLLSPHHLLIPYLPLPLHSTVPRLCTYGIISSFLDAYPFLLLVERSSLHQYFASPFHLYAFPHHIAPSSSCYPLASLIILNPSLQFLYPLISDSLGSLPGL